MYVLLILAFLFAALEAAAVSKNLRGLEYVAQPAVMVCLFLWLYLVTGLQGSPLWFGIGILFSLAGDVLLMTALDRLFLFGLIAFLFAHISYITGFWREIATISVWSLILLIIIAISAFRLLRPIVNAMQTRRQNKLIVPVVIYGIVISIMLYAAMSKLYIPGWKANAALFVGLGAFLFWISDLILAWNKFVSPINDGRLFNITTYHLGQIALIAGVISQFR